MLFVESLRSSGVARSTRPASRIPPPFLRLLLNPKHWLRLQISRSYAVIPPGWGFRAPWRPLAASELLLGPGQRCRDEQSGPCTEVRTLGGNARGGPRLAR